MNNTFHTEYILQEKLPRKYIIYLIMLFVLMLIFLFVQPLKFKTYLNINFLVKSVDNTSFFVAYIKDSELKYIVDNNKFKFNNKEYKYKVVSISEDNYVNNQNEVVKLVYIETDIESKYLIDNYAITAKIEKDYKRVYEYIKDIF